MPELNNSLAGQEDDHWGKRCVARARKEHPFVTDAVSGLLAEVLKGEVSERALTAGEVTALAKQLINGMVPATFPQNAESEPTV